MRASFFNWNLFFNHSRSEMTRLSNRKTATESKFRRTDAAQEAGKKDGGKTDRAE